ncbi:hypothetical protein [Thermococcus aciditolerans]|uniref:HEAT repeat domain-containing protein n=1 Tax=Thermococcus aciditolerans TaxID=2598455 RepID=A0A5C0SME2_9EURY|nr:hypothetical protein [Thermococcus aciditolerans]QEK14328.1 hypothetical protein FPV09_03525 [Thermococcus aciditolerans]
MGFFSFGSKRGKIKKLIEEERFDEALAIVIKDKKALEGLIELLDESSPGIRGDALLLLGMVAERRGDLLEGRLRTVFPKAVTLTLDRNPYVQENAMVLSYELARRFGGAVRALRAEVSDDIIRALVEGGRNLKGFAALMAGGLGMTEARPYIEELVGVEDKVILPFEGRKWVPLGEIAREALEKLP